MVWCAFRAEQKNDLMEVIFNDTLNNALHQFYRD